jgi:hypothetical protein
VCVERVAARQGLGVGDVERGPGDPAIVECVQQRGLVDQAAPAHVDHVDAGLDAGQGPGAEEMPRRGGGRRGDDKMVGGRQHLREAAPFHRRQRRRGIGAPDEPHQHAEGERPSRHLGGDAAGADQPQRPALEPTEVGHGPPLRRFAHPHVRQLLLECQHGRQHELGDRYGAGTAAAGERHLVGEDLDREPVDTRRQRVHPAHAPRHHVGEVGCAPGEREQNLALHSVGDGSIRRHVHHPRVDDAGDDPLRGVAAEVVQDRRRVGGGAHLRSRVPPRPGRRPPAA